MRTVMLTSVLAAMLLPATAEAADVYAPPHGYGAPRVYAPPPRYAAPVPVAPVIVERPPAVTTVPEGWAYVVPQPTYHRGSEYAQAPVLLDARAYRRCWEEWGQLRCAVWRGW